MSDLYRELRLPSRQRLFKAWRKVKSNGLSSNSERTRREIEAFADEVTVQIPLIQRQLAEKRFHFDPQIGVPVKKGKKSGDIRPLLIAPIRNRVVQRGILDVLQCKVPAVKEVLATENSIGGVPGRGTEHAIKLIVSAIKDGAIHYARSDISGFFKEIPRAEIVDFIGRNTGDPLFTDLFDAAVTTTLSNTAELSKHLNDFPVGDKGVAQGSPLSPLMGNILLRDFDRELHRDGITCVRYIDDFVILGASQKAVNKSMRKATKILTDFGMTVYDSATNPEKAATGSVRNGGLDFLGCSISGGLVSPNKAARERLLTKIDEAIREGKRGIHAAAKSTEPLDNGQCQLQTLARINGILRGWSHAYTFCNNSQVIKKLDEKVNQQVG